MSPAAEAIDHLSVVNRFLKHYYTIKVQKPHELYKFYGEDSKLCVGRSTEKTARQYLGIKSIQQYFAEDHPETSKESGARVQVQTIDWQPLPDDGLMILVVGHVVVPEPKNIDEKFVHTIYLFPQRTQTSVVYYVQNDILRYMGHEEVIVRPTPVDGESEAHAHAHLHVHPPQHPVHAEAHTHAQAHTSQLEEIEIHHPPPPHAPPAATHEPAPHQHEHVDPPVEHRVPEPTHESAPEAEPKHTHVEEQKHVEESSEHVSISMEGTASDMQEVNAAGEEEASVPIEEVAAAPATVESEQEAPVEKAPEQAPAPEAPETPQATVVEPVTTITPPVPEPEPEPEPEPVSTPAPAQPEPTPTPEHTPAPVVEKPAHTEHTQPPSSPHTPSSPRMPKSPKPVRAKEVHAEEKEKTQAETVVEAQGKEKEEVVAPAAVAPVPTEAKADDTPSAPTSEPAPSAPAQPPAPFTWASLAKAAGGTGTAPVLDRAVPVVTNVPKKAPAPVAAAPVAQRRPEQPKRPNGDVAPTHPPRTERPDRTPDRKGPALFINNVPLGVTEEELVTFFSEKMPKEFKIRGRSITQQKGQHTGRFGFVDIETQEGVNWCLRNGPWELRGVVLNVQNRVDPKTLRTGGSHPHQDHRGDDARRGGARGGRGGRGGYSGDRRPQGDRPPFQQKRPGQEQA